MAKTKYIKPVYILGIDDEVEDYLQNKQKNKEFRDAGERVGGSRKERAAYAALITSKDLESLEKDSVTAMEMVVKDKVFPKIDVDKEIENGVSSGAAYLKVKLREVYPSKPKYNTPESREIFVKFAEYMSSYFDNCFLLQDFYIAFRYFDDKSKTHLFYTKELAFVFFGNMSNILSHYKYSYYNKPTEETITNTDAYDLLNYKIKDNFGTEFHNLLNNYGKKYYSNKHWSLAKQYEGITQETEQKAIEKMIERNTEKIKEYEDKIAEIQNYPKEKVNELYDYFKKQNLVNPPPSDSLEKFKIWLVGYYKYDTNIEIFKVRIKNPKKHLSSEYKFREPDWSWTGKKKVSKREKSSELTINSGVPLNYIKRTGGLLIENVSEHEIIRLFGFKYVEFGNWVKDIEAQEHLRHFLGAYADLCEILNFNAIEITQMNNLSIAFGSRGKGKALAHYESHRQIINLTKKRGDGSVSHEWGHYFDNLIFHEVNSTASFSKPYATENYKSLKSVIGSKVIKTKDVINQIIDFIHKGYYFENGKTVYSQNNAKVKKIFFPQNKYQYSVGGKTLQENLDFLKSRYSYLFSLSNSKGQRDAVKVFGYLAHRFNLSFVEIEYELKGQSEYYFMSSQLKSKYWIENVELFARAFECYVYDKLQNSSRENNYLVSGGYFDHQAGVYPRGEERKTLYKLFDNLISAVKSDFEIMDFQAFTDKRVNEYIELNEKNDEAEVKTGVIIKTDNLGIPELLLTELKLMQ